MEYKGGNVQTVWYQGPGAANCRKPLSLGTAEALYVEDNEVHFSAEVVNPTGNNPWLVPYHGARAVIRHNKIVNSQLEIYRPGISQWLYGCQGSAHRAAWPALRGRLRGRNSSRGTREHARPVGIRRRQPRQAVSESRRTGVGPGEAGIQLTCDCPVIQGDSYRMKDKGNE